VQCRKALLYLLGENGKDNQLPAGTGNSKLQACKPFLRRFRVLVGKFVAHASQLCPLLRSRKPAELFQSVETVNGGQGGDLFALGTQYRGYESGPHIVLQTGIAVSKLVKQATVFLGKMFDVRWVETALLQINKGIG
jgi:hypothetical protein